MRQPLAVFELAQLVAHADQHVGVRADANTPTRAQIVARWEDAVAKAGFGDRAKAGRRAAPCERRCFVRRHMRRMDQAPAMIDVVMIE